MDRAFYDIQIASDGTIFYYSKLNVSYLIRYMHFNEYIFDKRCLCDFGLDAFTTCEGGGGGGGIY